MLSAFKCAKHELKPLVPVAGDCTFSNVPNPDGTATRKSNTYGRVRMPTLLFGAATLLEAFVTVTETSSPGRKLADGVKVIVAAPPEYEPNGAKPDARVRLPVKPPCTWKSCCAGGTVKVAAVMLVEKLTVTGAPTAAMFGFTVPLPLRGGVILVSVG